MKDRIIRYMEEALFESSHDIEHSFRVANNARRIAASMPGVDNELLEIACLLHDIAKIKEDRDKTRTTDHCILGAEEAKGFLLSLDYPPEKAAKVWEAIRYHRVYLPEKPLCIETKILYDAGILENLGAIGIARTFMIAGEFQEMLYNSEPIADYIAHNVNKESNKIIDYSIHSPNLEFELNWDNADQQLYTESARQIAKQRINFSRSFFFKLKEEITGVDKI